MGYLSHFVIGNIDDSLNLGLFQCCDCDPYRITFSGSSSVTLKQYSFAVYEETMKFAECDFEDFDMILAMDRGHLRALQKMAPAQHHAKIRLFVAGSDVPDPYYGGADGFEKVLDLVEAQCRRLIDELRQSPWDPIA